MSLNKSIVEEAVPARFANLGYAVSHGPHIEPDESGVAETKLEAIA